MKCFRRNDLKPHYSVRDQECSLHIIFRRKIDKTSQYDKAMNCPFGTCNYYMLRILRTIIFELSTLSAYELHISI